MSRPRLFSGARAILTFSGQLVVYATDCSYVVETDFKSIETIDNSFPVELAPGRIRVQVTCSQFRVHGNSPTATGIQPTVLNHMTQGYCSIELRDRQTDTTILYVPKAMCLRRSGKVNSRSLGSDTLSFIGIGFSDERAPQAARP